MRTPRGDVPRRRPRVDLELTAILGVPLAVVDRDGGRRTNADPHDEVVRRVVTVHIRRTARHLADRHGDGRAVLIPIDVTNRVAERVGTGE